MCDGSSDNDFYIIREKCFCEFIGESIILIEEVDEVDLSLDMLSKV